MTLPVATLSNGRRRWGVAAAVILALGAMTLQLARNLTAGRRIDTRELVLRDGQGNVRMRATAEGDEVKIVFDGNRDTSLSVGVDRDEVKIYGRSHESDAAVEMYAGRAVSYVNASYVKVGDDRASTTLGRYGLSSKGDRGFIKMKLEQDGPVIEGATEDRKRRLQLGSDSGAGMGLALHSPTASIEALASQGAWLRLRARSDRPGREVKLGARPEGSSLSFSDHDGQSRIHLSDGDEGKIKLVSGPKGSMYIRRHPNAAAQ